jgi:hypothetical protein
VSATLGIPKKTKNKFGLEQRDSVLNTLDFASPF